MFKRPSCNVFPNAAGNYVLNRGLRDAVPSLKVSLLCAAVELVTDGSNVKLGKLGVVVFRSTVNLLRSISFAFHHISDVIFWRSKSKMIWIAAGWCIARVQHMKVRICIAIRKSVSQGTRYAMGVNALLIQRNLTVTHGICCAYPQPAIGRRAALDLRPQRALGRAKPFMSPPSGERRAAMFTDLIGDWLSHSGRIAQACYV